MAELEPFFRLDYKDFYSREKMKTGYTYSSFEMRPDFPRPDFYKELFRMWGLDIE